MRRGGGRGGGEGAPHLESTYEWFPTKRPQLCGRIVGMLVPLGSKVSDGIALRLVLVRSDGPRPSNPLFCISAPSPARAVGSEELAGVRSAGWRGVGWGGGG